MPNDLNYVQIDQIENQHQKYKLVDSTARATLDTVLTTINNILAGNATPDTKNTAGATNSSNLLYLIGSTIQSTNPQTYSNSNVYIDNSNLYSNNNKVITIADVNRTGPLNNENNIIPSEQAVRSYVDNHNFLNYKGSVNLSNSLPLSNIIIGDTYRIAENGTYIGQNCRIGDLAIAINTNPIEWIFVHSSIDTSDFVISASGGLDITNQTVSHSNTPIIEQDTLGVYPIAFDEYGHIVDYGEEIELDQLININPGNDIQSIGSSNYQGESDNYAREDHTHALTGQTIIDALNYTPYNASNPDGYITGVQIGSSQAPISNGVADITDYISAGSTSVIPGTGLSAQPDGDYIRINHSNSTTAKTTSGVYPITIDAQGHITGSGSAITIPTVPTNISAFTNDAGYTTNIGTVTSVTVQGNNGLTGSGTVTTTGTITLSHADTSTATSSTNNGRTYIQSISLDNYGHVIDLSTGTETVTNTDTKVTQAYSTTNNSYPLLLSATANISSTSTRGDTTAILNNQIYANPSSGTLYTKALTVNGTAAGTAIFKNVDTSIANNSTSTNLPTSQAVSDFINGKNYITTANLPSPASIAPPSISSVNTVGNNSEYARQDHTHKFITYLNGNTYSPINGEINLGTVLTNLSFIYNSDNSSTDGAGSLTISASSGGTIAPAPVGTYLTYFTSSAISVTSNNAFNTNIASFTIPAHSCWNVNALARFASNTEGVRGLAIYQNNQGSYGSSDQYNYTKYTFYTLPITGSHMTVMQLPTIISNTTDSDKIYYINVLQTSGSELNVFGGYDMIRIS